MDFVLALHSHLPYVLNHGRWPHGSDWLCEAAIDTYLPLLEKLRELAAEGTRAPVTIGFTPILANQLVSPTFVTELEAYFTQRITACDEAATTIRGTADEHLIPLTDYWHERLERLRALFRSVDGDLVAPFRALEEAGHIEIIGGAATHGFLPLLGRDEKCWVKITGPERLSRTGPPFHDVVPYARALIQTAPRRVLCGTDWPHPNVPFMPNDGDLMDLVALYAPDEQGRTRLLVDNPARLFRFPS